MARKEPLFQRLSRLFRGGPVIRRKVKAVDTTTVAQNRNNSSLLAHIQKSVSPVYNQITSNAYNLAERQMRYQDFTEMEACLHGDTLIAVPGGFKKIKDLAEEFGLDKEFVVYAYDHNAKKLVPALAKQARHTITDCAYKVTFDNGQTIIGTPDHRLLKRNGHFCEIIDLKPGDAMMPFYRKDILEKYHKEDSKGYLWVYTMDKSENKSGWKSEHRLLAEWVYGRPLNENEVVHHINCVANDNRLENLVVLDKDEHDRIHKDNVLKLNQKKWSQQNKEWIDNFKKNHSKFMTENNPAERRDITFGVILEVAQKSDFNCRTVERILDVSRNAIVTKLSRHGYKNWETFAKAYNPDWKNFGQNNRGSNNPRFDKSLTVEHIYNVFAKEKSLEDIASELNTTIHKITNRLRAAGYKNYKDFSDSYQNLKVVSVEYFGVCDLYDLTVDGYKNFATDSVVSHNTPEIAAALDLYSDEIVAQDDKGRSLHVFSDDSKIKEILEELFYDTLNIEFNLRPWARNLCKYGDFLAYVDVHTNYGVQNLIPIPVNEIERQEGFDAEDPMAVKYRWLGLGNKELQNWEVMHMRLLGNDAFLPYGSSIIEPARRIWRQLILIEDAMLTYRITRAPERRVFYVDVGNLEPEAIPNYIEQQRQALRMNPVIDKSTGRVDMRYASLSLDEDYILPVRGTESGTKIDTLAGGQNVAAVEDVQYIQKKLFAALRIPRAYLGYEEGLASKSSLSQEDIRFSRTIQMIQRIVISELNKLAIIHLAAHGFDGEDLLKFSLRLSNPSTVAQQQKLELYRAKFEIAGTAPEGLVDRKFIRKNILGLTDEEIEDIESGKEDDRRRDLELEEMFGAGGGEVGGGGGGGASSLAVEPGGAAGVGGEDLFGGGEGAPEGGAEAGGGAGGEAPEAETPETPENAGVNPEEDEEPELELLTSGEDPSEDGPKSISFSPFSEKMPIKAKSQLEKYKYNRGRARTHGARKTGFSDIIRALDPHSPENRDPNDSGHLRSMYTNPFGESMLDDFDEDDRLHEIVKPRLTKDVKQMIHGMQVAKKLPVHSSILSENNESGDIEDLLESNLNEQLINSVEEDDE